MSPSLIATWAELDSFLSSISGKLDLADYQYLFRLRCRMDLYIDADTDAELRSQAIAQDRSVA